MLVVKKQRSKSKPLSSHRLSGGRSLSILSPTAEERFKEDSPESPVQFSNTNEDQTATIESPCPNPPCTSGSLRPLSSPLRNDVYSPSTSSDAGSFPSNMIPLPSHQEEPVGSGLLRKENKNPRPNAPASIQAGSVEEVDPFDHASKQQLHFMSNPNFSNSTPSKSSRKKVRPSKESSGSTGKAKSAHSPGSHAKLQKQSPASIERGKPRYQKKSKPDAESHNAVPLESRDFDAELKKFVADWTALDTRRKILQAGKSKNNFQGLKAALDAEQADLEARYESIRADKAAYERHFAPLEAKHEANKAEHEGSENSTATTGSAQPPGAMSPQKRSESQETISIRSHERIVQNKQYPTSDIDPLESAPKDSDQVVKPASSEKDIVSQHSNSEELGNLGEKDRDLAHVEAEQTHRARKSTKPILEQGQNNNNLAAELAAFTASVAIWKDKWKTYNQGKTTLSSFEKKVYDEEKDELAGRWRDLKDRVDTQKDETKDHAESSLLLSKHLVVAESETSPSVTTPSKEQNKFSGASPHTTEDQPKSPRRTGGSDPGLQPRGRSHSPRRVSKSLYEDPRRKRNLFDLSRASRDPLSRISREDDDASLAVLAQVLDVDPEDDLLKDTPQPDDADNSLITKSAAQTTRPIFVLETTTTIKTLDEPQIQDNDSQSSISIEAISQTIISEVSASQEAGSTKALRNEEAVFETRQDIAISCDGADPPISDPENARSPIEITIPGQTMQVPAEKSTSQMRRSTVPMMSSHGRDSGPSTPKTAGSPSKISALVAKFNQGNPPSTEPISTTASPMKSPAKTPRRTTAEMQANAGTPKDSLVSPYTTNATSPARSQKSEKTPQSTRSAVTADARSLLDPKSSPVRKPTPKRILRDSLQDSTPLRPVVRGARSPRSTPSPTKASNPYGVSLRSVQKHRDGSPTRLPTAPTRDTARDKSELHRAAIDGQSSPQLPKIASAAILPPPRFNINSFLMSEVHAKESSASSSRTVQPVHGSVDNLAATIDQANSELDNVQLKPVVLSRSQADVSDLPDFDGPGGPSNIGRVLPHPDPLPIAHHLNLARPPAIVHADVEDTRATSVSEFRNPPPGRSSSLLYNQVRNLQRQLSEKVEEIQHLRQQLSARGNLEVGTLSEELREAKRDLQAWKTRAEIAEKQLENLTKLPSRSNSLKHITSTSSRRADQYQRSSLDSRKEEGTMADRIRKAFHGMDGADSPLQWGSEESTNTVVRDLKDVVTGSEYSMWAEQTMNAIDSTDTGEEIR